MSGAGVAFLWTAVTAAALAVFPPFTSIRQADDTAGAKPPAPTAVPAQPTAPPAVDFEKDVRPIVARCQPCHFAGGKMYEKLPFDRPETIRTLGEKLFTRIKDAREQDVIRRFLAQASHKASTAS